MIGEKGEEDRPGGEDKPVEVVSGPKIVPLEDRALMEMRLRICENDVGKVTLRWQKVANGEEGTMGPIAVQSDGCVDFSIDVPAEQSHYYFELYAGEEASGAPMWRASTYLGLAGGEPLLAPEL